MPTSYSIDSARSLVLSRGWGVVTLRDLADHARALENDARFRPELAQLVDLREITELEATSEGIRTMAEISPFGSGALRAFVAHQDSIFGMTRMFELLRDRSPDKVRVFRDLRAALQWLELEGDEAEWSQALARADATFGIESR